MPTKKNQALDGSGTDEMEVNLCVFQMLKSVPSLSLAGVSDDQGIRLRPMNEIADHLGVFRPTVDLDWRAARAFLRLSLR